VHIGERRRTSNVIVGSTMQGETMRIPAHAFIELAQVPRDWGRVVVWWNRQLVEISRGAW
jgi:hypothetical protein